MLGYIYKELKINKVILSVMLICAVFLNLTPLAASNSENNPEGTIFYAIFFIMTGSSFLVIGMCASGLVQTDERKKWGYYNAAAPNGIRFQVGSIYTIILSVLLLDILIAFFCNIIVRQIIPDAPNVSGMLFVMALLVLLFRAIELPFFYAFGSKIGGLVKSLLLFILIFLAVLYFLFADLSWLGSQDEVIGKFFEIMSSLSVKSIWSSVVGKILLSAVPLYAVSYYISTKVYLRGVDRLEK